MANWWSHDLDLYAGDRRPLRLSDTHRCRGLALAIGLACQRCPLLSHPEAIAERLRSNGTGGPYGAPWSGAWVRWFLRFDWAGGNQ